MLQIPTNVYPDNEVVVISKHTNSSGEYDRNPHFSYTFNGDQLRWTLCEYIDNTTEEIIGYSYFPKGGDINVYYNGDKVSVDERVFTSLANNGNDYKYRYTLFSTEPNTDNGLYNIYFCRGKIITANSSSNFFITDGIENLKNPYIFTYADNTTKLVGGCYIEMYSGTTKQRRMISAYNKSTGEITLSSSFSFTPAEGDTYKIFTNYLITPYYYVKCRANPVISLALTNCVSGIKCDLTYSQSNHIGLKYYKLKLYEINSHVIKDNGTIISNVNNKILNIGTDKTVLAGDKIKIATTVEDTQMTDYVVFNIANYDATTGYLTVYVDCSDILDGATYETYSSSDDLVEESDAIYTYDLKYTFIRYISGKKYRVEAEVVTQEDVRVTTNKNITCPSLSTGNSQQLTVFSNNTNHTNTLSWANPRSSAYVYRYDGKNSLTPKLLMKTTDTSVVDYTACSGHKYKYLIVFDRYGLQIVSDWITTDFRGCSLVALKENTIDTTVNSNAMLSSLLSKPTYTAGSVWTFMSDINCGDITSNIGNQLYVGTGVKPTTTRIDTDYENGSFSSIMSTLNCSTYQFKDDIYRVNAWRDFITAQQSFLLKSVKGDCWIINITDAPTRSYDNSMIQLLTSVSYSWTECEDIDNSIIN